jgi:hypothetical protein
VLDLHRAQDGGSATDATRVRLLEDGLRLFVRFDCDDRDVWATHTVRDAPLWEEEAVEIFLAPGESDPKRYYEIQVNPLGTVFDAVVSNPDGRRATMVVDPAWDPATLEARARRVASSGWRAEILLPWSEVSGADEPVWRANFFRIERRRDAPAEFTCWSPTLADPPDFHLPAWFGRLVRSSVTADAEDLDM